MHQAVPSAGHDTMPRQHFQDPGDMHSKPIRYPYDPQTWLERAEAHAKLKCPELVVGDCWKALFMCNQIMTTWERQPEWQLGYRCGFWMFADYPEFANPAQTSMLMLRDCERRVNELQSRYLSYIPGVGFGGHFMAQEYPWSAVQHRMRDDIMLDRVNKSLVSWPCSVQRHALTGARSDNALGVFAKTDLAAGQLVLVDETDVWGCILSDGLTRNVEEGDEGTLSWLGLSQAEASTLLDLLHDTQCNGADQPRAMLKIRCLMQMAQDGAQHPLDHPLIASLQGTYHSKQPTSFSVLEDIEIPNKTLLVLGIDIFANCNFDTWTLFTLEARIDNNCFITPSSTCLCPLFALFNHSCSPSVQWDTTKCHRGVHLRAKQAVRAGEQLFVSYSEYATVKPLLERQADLSRWIDGPCRCTRCEEESHATHDMGASEHAISAPLWDMTGVVVLPEDRISLRDKLVNTDSAC